MFQQKDMSKGWKGAVGDAAPHPKCKLPSVIPKRFYSQQGKTLAPWKSGYFRILYLQSHPKRSKFPCLGWLREQKLFMTSVLASLWTHGFVISCSSNFQYNSKCFGTFWMSLFMENLKFYKYYYALLSICRLLYSHRNYAIISKTIN